MANQLQELVQDISTYLNTPTIEAPLAEKIFGKCITIFHCIADIVSGDLTALPPEYPELIKDAMTAMNILLFIKFSDISIKKSIADEIQSINDYYIDALACIVAAVNQYKKMMESDDSYAKGQIDFNKSLIKFQRHINQIKRQLS